MGGRCSHHQNSFEHLCAEKAYLTASLKNQDDREVGLMRKLSMLQEMIDSWLPSKERRKSRKKAALMKSRIMEAAAQKKAIILRLGEIYVELQSRETWMQIQSELYERRCSLDPHSAPCATTPSDVTSMIPTPLDATSPVFFPTSYHPLHGTWEAMPSHSEFQMYASLGGLQAEFWPEGSNAFDIRADELGNHGLRFEYEDHVLTPGVDEERNRCPSRNDSLRSLDRRMSLPALKCLWPGSE
ncbi:hypothetical protein LZ32DRAFT_362427 [Colletotrichum eremochloae]|nr:hypothetical protein LZ32DRAFT_362427 [Colletotrichum eremochloae]